MLCNYYLSFHLDFVLEGDELPFNLLWLSSRIKALITEPRYQLSDQND